ncbi:MAG: hypothetical protein ACI4NP_03150 [Thermoguttaceae bacterium]
MPFTDNRRLRLIAGVVTLFFLAAPLSARGVDASTPVPEKIEVSEAVVTELDAYINSFFESVRKETATEYTDKASYIFEYAIKNMDNVDDPASLVERVAPVAIALERSSPDMGVQYMTALRDALPPLAIEGRKFDSVMTAAKCKVYAILIKRELDKAEGTPNVKKPVHELAKLVEENEYAAFAAQEIAHTLKTKDSDAAALLYGATLRFINKDVGSYPSWKKLVELEMDETSEEKLEKEARDDKAGLSDLRKKISAATASSGKNLSFVKRLDRVLGLDELQRRVYYAKSVDKTISYKEAMELQKEIAPALTKETCLLVSAPGGNVETSCYLLENALHTALALEDGDGLLDAYKTVITTSGDPKIRRLARRFAVDGLLLQMKKAKDEDAKLQVVQTLRDFVTTDSLFIMSAPKFFQKIDSADLAPVLPLFNEYLTSLQGSEKLVSNYIVAKGVKWHYENSMTMKRQAVRRERVNRLRDEYEALGYLLRIKESLYEGDTRKAKLLAEQFEAVSSLNESVKKMTPQVKELIEGPKSEMGPAEPAI